MERRTSQLKKLARGLHETPQIDPNSLDWFDILNYECVREYSRENLSFQLSIRNISIANDLEEDLKKGIDRDFLIFTLFSISSKKFLSKHMHDTDDNTEESIAQFSDYDFWDSVKKVISNKVTKNRFEHTYNKLKKLISSVHEDTLSDLADDIIYENGLFQDDILLDWDDHFLWIDTNFSDEKILSDVKRWLKKKREHKKEKQRISDVEFRKWITQPRLAYIDLYLWQKITGNELTYPKIVQLLYPNDRNMTPDNFKKTIAEKTIKEFRDRTFHYRFI